jgi:hypothetical protein
MPRIALVLALLAAVACGPPARQGATTRYQGMVLNARELGHAELDRLAAGDATLRDYLEREGRPDFILEATPHDLELIYVQKSRVVLFRRPTPDAPTLVGTTEPLPTPILSLLPADLRAGTGEPFPSAGVSCWTVDVAAEACRTCCAAPVSCSYGCTPR